MMKRAKRQNFIIILCLIAVFTINSAAAPGDRPVGAISLGSYSQARKAYVGGFPVGLSIKTDGVMVTAVVPIQTEVGAVLPSTELRPGDLIHKIEGRDIFYINDILESLRAQPADKGKITLLISRGEEVFETESVLLKEEFSGSVKLGLAVKDTVSGVGTVSYIKPDGTFGCLGHAICDAESGHIVPCVSGSVYRCKIIGYNKGVRGRAGELKGVFVGSVPCGVIAKNERYGVYGKLNENLSFGEILEIGDRREVTVGKAQILSTVQSKPETYEIEIIKAMGQNVPDDKSMVIRVTDKRLLSTTGGIVQGMSGSPILQNHKIVGAVTHVFVNDPTKGYGVYADWMYDN